MAERRMFAKSVIESDAFLDLPATARLLYFDLGMRGDDDGFVDSPKRIMRLTGASDDDLRLLIAKQFLIPFMSGVTVVRHWKLHNYIRSDRYKPTQYQEEKSQLSEGTNGIYFARLSLGIPNDYQMSPECLPLGSIGEGRVIEDNKEEYILHGAETAPCRLAVISLMLNDKTEYPIFEEQTHKWAELYPAVDVIQQLRNMKGWLDANPKKRKTKSGILRFINTWLSKEQDKGGSMSSEKPSREIEKDIEKHRPDANRPEDWRIGG